MNRPMFRAAAFAILAAVPLAAQAPRAVNFFEQVASHGVSGGIAEIVAASPSGDTLVFSDASSGRIGFVDIHDPAQPAALPDVVTGGQPTSVDWAGDYVVVAVQTAPPQIGRPAPDPFAPANAGRLFVIDASDPRAPVVLGTVAIGFQPDSLKLMEHGGELVAVVCIENEPVVVDEHGSVLDEDLPGFPTSGSTFPQDRSPAGLVQVVRIDVSNVARSTVADVVLDAMTLDAAGCLFPADAQPEFVDVHGTLAAITLQENNGIALIDVSMPSAPVLVRVFACGNAGERRADLTDDAAIALREGYPSSIGTTIPAPTDGRGRPLPGGPLQPDAIAFSPDGSMVFTADEGELDLTGGRGFSGFTLGGRRVFDDRGAMEELAVRFGQYPDGRSENRGIEVEGIAAATYGRRDFLFVTSERGSFMAVYALAAGNRPRFVQFLPTGISPEGIVPIPQRNLLVTADEVSGTLTIFRGRASLPVDTRRPLAFGTTSPFGALSGFDGAGFGAFAVPDDALPTTIYAVLLGGPFAAVAPVLPVTRAGRSARYDGEGLVRDRSILAPFRLFGGFWIASEGDGTTRPNLLVQVDLRGRVVREIQMPQHIDAAADASLGGRAIGSAAGGRIRGNGFEGVTLSADGRYLFAVIQREFAGEPATHTRIARYDLRQIADRSAPRSGLRVGGDWDFFYYPLEASTGAGFVGLSEITRIGDGRFLVIERDQGIGSEAALKAIYALDLSGLVTDTDGRPGEVGGSDVARKLLVADVRREFFPFEKVECVALVRGHLWVGLDNDGGEVANRIVDLGRFVDPLRR